MRWLALLLASNAWTAYTVDQYVRDRALVRVQQRDGGFEAVEVGS